MSSINIYVIEGSHPYLDLWYGLDVRRAAALDDRRELRVGSVAARVLDGRLLLRKEAEQRDARLLARDGPVQLLHEDERRLREALALGLAVGRQQRLVVRRLLPDPPG